MKSLPRRKRGPVKAVQYSVPGNDVVSAVPPQKGLFNISKHIAKPLIYDASMKGKMGFVPLKSDQLFSHAEGAMLFNAPELLVLEKLDVPSNDFYNKISFDPTEVDVPFTEGLAYKMGIRPSAGPRLLKAQPVPAEPTAPYPNRPTPANPFAKRTTRLKTYSLGKLDLEALSR